MDWTQTLTIISSMVAVWYAFYHIVKEDIKRHDIEIGEMRQEFSKVHALWASLLKEISETQKQIFDIKLDQSKKA
ncbi:MAG TPA: hypothetical protein PLY23_09030 [Alphaproteobacteria bacterium]|nr:hypothetical protein [Alphaproteobacteria bacterium]HQS94756.1 hypothetical protein [Alphaproteobacteria bacterium]